MARSVRIEFDGAFYHVMARGDRREAIVRDDEDRATFLRTLGEACKRSGFRVHAYALMTNHYHLLVETPEANLSRGMGWLQNAFTRRINTRHRLWAAKGVSHLLLLFFISRYFFDAWPDQFGSSSRARFTT